MPAARGPLLGTARASLLGAGKACLAKRLWWIVATSQSVPMVATNTPKAVSLALTSIWTPAINATTPINDVTAKYALLPWIS